MTLLGNLIQRWWKWRKK